MAALADFARYVRLEVPACPEPVATDAMLRACIDFCTRTELLSEIVSLNTVASQAAYAVASTDNTLYPAIVRAVLKNKLPLTPLDAPRYALLAERTESGSPEYYYAPNRGALRLARIPDAIEALELDLVLCPKRTATTVPDSLYEEWVSELASGAKALLLLMTGSPWANADLGAYHKGLYDSAVATAAASAANGNARAAMHVAMTPI